VSAVAVESMLAEIGGLGAAAGVERQRRPLEVELERREPLGMARILKLEWKLLVLLIFMFFGR
jgi:hypothetical protein